MNSRNIIVITFFIALSPDADGVRLKIKNERLKKKIRELVNRIVGQKFTINFVIMN
jgi:hypothetical protein